MNKTKGGCDLNIIKKWIINIAKKNQIIRSLLRFVMDINKKTWYRRACKKAKIQEKLVLFEAYMGRSYSCSPRAIYEEMIRDEKFKDFEFVWFFQEPDMKKEVPQLNRAKLVEYNSKEYYEYYAKAKYFISNSRIPGVIKKREGQVYIQCWHGTPLKILGYDIQVEGSNAMNSLKDIKDKYRTDAERFTYLLSPSKFTSEKLSSCFNLKENNPNTVILEEGYPRNDFLYNYTKDDINRIKRKIGIQNIENKKIILYAPTWRDNQHTSGVGYTYELGINFDKLQEEIGKDYIILFRTHYFIANSFDFDKYKDFIYNVSNIDDVNELYIISDLLITDYSSVFFDYANLKRPMLFYMYDIDEYENKLRGFYIDLHELPGPISKTEEDLIKNIHSIDKIKKEYEEKYKIFNEKFNYLDDGQASKRVVTYI